MTWQKLTVVATRAAHTGIESVLEDNGALAITTEDAGDQPVLEPGIGETPLWPQLRITGLFGANAQRSPIDQQLMSLDSIRQAEQLIWQTVADQDWERAWMDRFQPMDFGNGLWVCPSGQPIPETAAHVLELDPGLAFGTGTHPTTELCLRWLSSNRDRLADAQVLDYGCGSGILGIAAALLGANTVVAVDHDPQALVATQDNARKNGVTSRLKTCLPAEAPDPEARFDLVIANILAGPLIQLADLLSRHRAPDGALVLSGILSNQAKEVAAAYAPGLALHAESLDNWVLLS